MASFSKTLQTIKDIITGEEKSFTLTQELKDCVEVMENTESNIFITGKAGTGKSTLIDYFRNTTRKKTVVLAPTGLAAINVRGQTLHSFFHLPPRFITPDAIARRVNSRIYRDLDTIIIDEISMVRADVLDGIDHFLRLHGKDRMLPFGGIQMIFVGDLYQLPPIVTREDIDIFRQRYESPYFFSAEAFQDTNCTVIELTNIFRQKDTKFITILNKIRIGDITTSDLAMINERIVTKDYEKVRKEYVTLATTNSVVGAINDSELNKINESVHAYSATIEGNFPTEDRALPVDLELKLKKGARVIFVKNDKGRRWVNGTLGTVHDIGDEGIKIKIDDEGFHEIVTVEPESWENVKYNYDEEKGEVNASVLGTLKQYPLKLAWAITIHKSQGMTFSKVNIDFSKSPFTHGQTYVALSRCRTLEGIVLTKKIWPNDVIVDERIISFSQKLARM
ncbi:MAG TPA: AAA family ATPase [Candidatus Saccharimonadales bacterium]|nr:AAA family ATPase [Candidatus Saccharimonadales bacterium]